VKFLPPRVALVFTAVAAATVASGVLLSRVLADRREQAATVAQGWRTVAALERARSVLLEAEAACGGPVAPAARCAATKGELERVVTDLRAAMAYRPDRRRAVARLETMLRGFVGTVARGTWLGGGNARPATAEAALTAFQQEEARELTVRERNAERSASLATVVVVATDVALLLLVAIAAFSVRGHLREREQREREHARVLQLQQQLLGMVGHDLRTPLSAIAGSAALLARDRDLPSSRVRLVQRIVSSAGRMSRLVRDLLDFTRVRTEGHLPVSPEPVNLGALCRRVAQEVAAARPRTIVCCEVEGDVTGEWDPARLEQVVSNLITNACQHGTLGRPVQVRVTGLDDAVRIAVHNEGPPIPHDVLPHIFEPFRRGDERPGRTGLGLGLHIVRTLVEAHGGTIDVTSGEGGTTFAVVLPAAGATPARRSEPPQATSAH
jgi:signal transduction histidine kinase